MYENLNLKNRNRLLLVFSVPSGASNFVLPRYCYAKRNVARHCAMRPERSVHYTYSTRTTVLLDSRYPVAVVGIYERLLPFCPSAIPASLWKKTMNGGAHGTHYCLLTIPNLKGGKKVHLNESGNRGDCA